MKISFIATLVGVACVPQILFAATLSLDPNGGEHGPGETFVLNLRVDLANETECINAADIFIDYPKDLVKAVAISKGESIMTLWSEEPKVDLENGKIHLSGGIPGGYCGRVLGDPGKTDVIAKLVFSVPAFQVGGVSPVTETPTTISIGEGTTLLLNDGQGTPASLVKKDATFTRLLESKNLRNEWTEAIQDDTLPPDEFNAEIQQSGIAYNGKYFLVFSTVDKQSGMSHFEVLEEDADRPGKQRGGRQATVFVRTTSPYVLKDQTLNSKITVRAYDNAGNRRDVVVLPKGTPQHSATLMSDVSWAPIVSIIAVLLILIGYIVYRMLKKRSYPTM